MKTFKEIAKVNEILCSSCAGVDTDGRIGIRVNPEVGAGLLLFIILIIINYINYIYY